METRLNQIRDYIRVTSTMIDTLNQSSNPVSIDVRILIQILRIVKINIVQLIYK